MHPTTVVFLHQTKCTLQQRQKGLLNIKVKVLQQSVTKIRAVIVTALVALHTAA
jgi:hypothetical protein